MARKYRWHCASRKPGNQLLVLDTHAEEVFIGLWDEGSSLWESRAEFAGGRELNSLIIKKLDEVLLNSQEYRSTLGGIIVAAGPGSFTGLRIGISVANTLAYALNIPIVSVVGENTEGRLLEEGLNLLKSVGLEFSTVVIPSYGAEPHITKSKK
jgi:tRNA threonylcarbamoyladenosine biosynthesis protein TsaB